MTIVAYGPANSSWTVVSGLCRSAAEAALIAILTRDGLTFKDDRTGRTLTVTYRVEDGDA